MGCIQLRRLKLSHSLVIDAPSISCHRSFLKPIGLSASCNQIGIIFTNSSLRNYAVFQDEIGFRIIEAITQPFNRSFDRGFLVCI